MPAPRWFHVRRTDAAQRLPVGRRSLIVLFATVPLLGIGIVLLAVSGLKTVLIDVGLRQPDVQVRVLAWLSPCGRRLITGSDAATTTVERGHPPHETLQRDDSGAEGRTMFLAIDTTAPATDALAMLDSQLRTLGYHPASTVSGVTAYDGISGTVSTHIASLHDHKVTVVVAQHAPLG